MTTDQYFRMPETVLPQELVWGVVRDAPAPAPGHQWMVGDLYAALRRHLGHTGFGRVWVSPIDVVLDRSKHLVVQPDLVVIAESRIGMVTNRIWGAPDLVIEILSPDPRIGMLEERLGWFAQYDVRECWLVDQMRSEVEVVRFASGVIAGRERFEWTDRIRSAVLPAFDLSLESIVNG